MIWWDQFITLCYVMLFWLCKENVFKLGLWSKGLWLCKGSLFRDQSSRKCREYLLLTGSLMIANVWILITISLGYSNIFKILLCLDFEYLIEFIWASLLPEVTLIFKILLAISSNLQNRSLILGILIRINMYVGGFHGSICLVK